MKIFKDIKVVGSLTFLIGLSMGIYIAAQRGIPFVGLKEGWSIGILVGETPFELHPPEGIKNPVLTADDVTDIRATFVADPFMVVADSKFYMFFEVLNEKTDQGDIGLAISSNGMDWKYQQIVLDEPFHLSYPYVFNWNGDYYMIPESYKDSSIRLYKATNFPTEWKFVAPLLTRSDFVDPSIFRFRDKWWMFFSSTRNDILRLYFADELTGPWSEHPQSPLIEKDPNIARPGGRVLAFQDKLFRFAQDDHPRYGNQLNAFEITTLDPMSYKETPLTENPILQATGKGWNGIGMHNIDPHLLDNGKWIACVDGYGVKRVFGLNY